MTATEELTAAALAGWGTSTVMNPLEALMWRGEAEPRLRSPILGIELLDRVPDWDRVLAAYEWGVLAIPRARQKVVEPLFGLGTPAWVTDPHFDLTYHLRRVTLPGSGTMRELLDLAQALAMTPFDRARPPWEAVLVDGLDGDRAAFITKLHHSTTDGLGGMQLIGAARSRTPDHTDNKPVAPLRVQEPSANPARLLAEQARARIRGWPGEAARLVTAPLHAAQTALSRPQTPIEEAFEYLSSVSRIVGGTPAPPSPLLTGRSLSWRFESYELPLADLKAGARAADGSVNDGYIAALLGAFRRYHEYFGVEIEEMPVAFPISLRRGDDPMGGNRFAGAKFAGPVGETDTAERVRQVRQMVLNAKSEPAVDALDRVSGLLLRLPIQVMTRIMLSVGRANDLQASNVPGIPYPVYLAGARVTHFYPFGPLPGCAAMLAMVSHNGICCVGANLDAAAVTEPAVFAQCLAEGFEEVVALGRG